MGRAIATVAGFILAVAAIVYGSFAIYEGSWSLTAHTVQHQLEIQKQIANGEAQNIATGWSFQTMLGQQITNGIAAVNTDTSDIDNATAQGLTTLATDLKSQRQSDVNTVCAYSSQINGSLPVNQPQTTWIKKNCSSGTISPSSMYYYTGN